MNETNADIQHSTFSSALSDGQVSSLSSRRLVILIPNAESANPELARRVWELASPSGLHVLFLGMCLDVIEEPILRRQLVTLAAAVQDNKVHTDIRIEHENDWIDKVKAILRPGDTLVCVAEQQAGMKHIPLSQVLTSNFEAPVHILYGLNLPQKTARTSFLSQVVSWSGLIGILLGFFWVQVKIEQLPKDWAHTALFYISVGVEIGLLWLWNSLTA